MAFNLMDLMNEETRKAAVDSFKVEMVDIRQIVVAEDNFYHVETEKINSMVASIEATGIQQPLIVQKKGDKYQIISGETRYRALRILHLQSGINEESYRMVPCRIMEDLSEEDRKLLLVLTNSTQRERTDYEKMLEIKVLRDSLKAKKEQEGKGFKMQQYLSELTGMSKSAIGRLDNIRTHLSKDLLEAYRKEEINTSAADAIASLDKEKQELVLERLRSLGKITAGEVWEMFSHPDLGCEEAEPDEEQAGTEALEKLQILPREGEAVGTMQLGSLMGLNIVHSQNVPKFQHQEPEEEAGEGMSPESGSGTLPDDMELLEKLDAMSEDELAQAIAQMPNEVIDRIVPQMKEGLYDRALELLNTLFCSEEPPDSAVEKFIAHHKDWLYKGINAEELSKKLGTSGYGYGGYNYSSDAKGVSFDEHWKSYKKMTFGWLSKKIMELGGMLPETQRAASDTEKLSSVVPSDVQYASSDAQNKGIERLNNRYRRETEYSVFVMYWEDKEMKQALPWTPEGDLAILQASLDEYKQEVEVVQAMIVKRECFYAHKCIQSWQK